MGAGHSHEPSETLPPAPPNLRRIVTLVIVPLVVATLVGLIVLWPRGETAQQPVGHPAPPARRGRRGDPALPAWAPP